MQRYSSCIVIYTTLAIGGGSLVLFYLFLFHGSFDFIDFEMSTAEILALDAVLCLIFFLQHSILVRTSIRKKLEKQIPDDYYGAFYAVTSGIPLLVMTIFWQKTGTIAAAGDMSKVLLRVLFFLAIAGFYWGIKSLRSFDPFGTIKLRRAVNGIKAKPLPMAVRGPYRFMRHPLYFFSLIMIWTCPELTQDRLLFNILWTAWIVIATKLEERDLAAEFGESYRKYQAEVPMLLPYKIFKNIS